MARGLAAIQCGSVQLQQRLKKTDATLNTEALVLAHLSKRACEDDHALGVIYFEPASPTDSSKRSEHPARTAECPRSPPRVTAAAISADGKLSKVESFERRVEAEKARCVDIASEAALALASARADSLSARQAREAEHCAAVGLYSQHLHDVMHRSDAMRASNSTLKTELFTTTRKLDVLRASHETERSEHSTT